MFEAMKSCFFRTIQRVRLGKALEIMSRQYIRVRNLTILIETRLYMDLIVSQSMHMARLASNMPPCILLMKQIFDILILSPVFSKYFDFQYTFACSVYSGKISIC